MDDAKGTVDVLIAEDNEVNQLVFSFVLEEAGLSFVIVGDGAEAVERFRELRPAIVIMDLSMPGLNGFEATARIREIEERTGGHATIIAATAHALNGDCDRCLQAGMDDYIAKPLSPDRFRDLLLRWRRTAFEKAAV